MFSTLARARQAIAALKDKEGFNNTDGCFNIARFSVNFEKDPKEKSGIFLYELSHEYLDSDGYDRFTVFGIYSTYNEAKKEYLKNLKKHPFSSFSEGFLISEQKVDVCGWNDGFSPW